MLNCLRHPERLAVTSVHDPNLGWERRYMCKECADKLRGFAYDSACGSGLSSGAAQAQRESKDYAEQYERMMPGRTPLKEGFR